MPELEIISVSQYLDKLNSTLKMEKAKIIGEVLDLKMSDKWTFIYFCIKDKKDGSILQCIMGKSDYQIAGVKLVDGIEVIIKGFPGIYKQKGEMKFRAEFAELVGEGTLKIAYEKLKNKLELEGLFSPERKRQLPDYPHKIGVITSKNGAVINDFLMNIGKFGYEMLFVDSKVEGQDAVKDLLSAVHTLKDKGVDVLVIMRGGGSLESFQAFNNEMLVRAVASFPAPVLTGIGHDKDLPLLSLVSDKNVSTPTAVANELNSSWDDALSLVNLSEEKILRHFSSLLDIFTRVEETLLRAVQKVDSGITKISAIISQETKDLNRGFLELTQNVKDFLSQSAKTIELSNPIRQLTHGYSIVRNNGKVIRSVKDAMPGDNLDVMVSDGTIKTKTI